MSLFACSLPVFVLMVVYNVHIFFSFHVLVASFSHRKIYEMVIFKCHHHNTIVHRRKLTVIKSRKLDNE